MYGFAPYRYACYVQTLNKNRKLQSKVMDCSAILNVQDVHVYAFHFICKIYVFIVIVSHILIDIFLGEHFFFWS